MTKIIKYISIVIIVIVVLVLYKMYGTSPVETPEISPVPVDPVTLLNVKKDGFNQAESWKHINDVTQIAIKTDTVEIVSCVPNPRIISVKQNSEITFVNNDVISQVIIFNPSHSFSVRPGTSTSTMANFGGKPGLYPYKCNGNPTEVGMVLITE